MRLLSKQLSQRMLFSTGEVTLFCRQPFHTTQADSDPKKLSDNSPTQSVTITTGCLVAIQTLQKMSAAFISKVLLWSLSPISCNPKGRVWWCISHKTSVRRRSLKVILPNVWKSAGEGQAGLQKRFWFLRCMNGPFNEAFPSFGFMKPFSRLFLLLWRNLTPGTVRRAG